MRSIILTIIVSLAISIESSHIEDAGQLVTYIINECRESPGDFAQFFKENVLSALENYSDQISQLQKQEILRASEDFVLFLQYGDSRFRLQYSSGLSEIAILQSLKMKLIGRLGHYFQSYESKVFKRF